MLIKLRSRYVGSLEEKIRRLEQELQQTQQAAGTRQTIEPLLTHPLSDAALVNDFNRQNPPPQPRLSRTQSVQPISSDPTGSSLEKDHDLIKVLKYGKSMMLKRILKADGDNQEKSLFIRLSLILALLHRGPLHPKPPRYNTQICKI